MGAVDCIFSSGQYQLVSVLNVWNDTGCSGSVGSVPIKLWLNRLVSSSSEGEGESANQRITFGLSSWFRCCLAVVCEIDGEFIFCYDFTITIDSYKTVIVSRFFNE